MEFGVHEIGRARDALLGAHEQRAIHVEQHEHRAAEVQHVDAAQHELEQQLACKKNVTFHEDFVSLTVMCYIKENIKNLMIVPAKRAQMFWAALMAQFMVIIMLICMY